MDQNLIFVLGTGAVVLVLVLLKVAGVCGGKKAAKSSKKETEDAGDVALEPRNYKKFKLVNKNVLNHNTTVFRFELPTPTTRLGLPVGKHMLLKFAQPPHSEGNASDETKEVSRPYTPISSDDDLGHFDLLIKLYDNGVMSKYLKKLEVGQSMDVRGPMGNLTYFGNGEFVIKRKNPESGAAENYERKVKHIGMIAGGSGITPMYQIIRDVCEHGDNETKISLVFGNVTESDILLRNELKTFADENKNFHCYLTLDKPPAGWDQGSGFVTKDMIRAHLPPPGDDVIILLCGPPGMIQFMEKNLTEMNYTADMYFKY